MKAFIKTAAPILSLLMFLVSSCKKDNEKDPSFSSVKNTSWMATITVSGNTTDQNIFEFGGNESVFVWHPVANGSFNGSWTQDGAKVSFVFIEQTTGGDYFWDNTGTLSSDGSTFTGTMQRRAAQGSGTFTAKRL